MMSGEIRKRDGRGRPGTSRGGGVGGATPGPGTVGAPGMAMAGSNPGPRRKGTEQQRRLVLAAWRREDSESRQRSSQPLMKGLDALVPAVLKQIGIERKQAEAEILRVWDHLVDPSVTAHARPVGLKNGTLFVRVDNSMWLEEIVRYRRREILDRLQHSFGADCIARISFSLG